ncbi:AbiH family protein [Pediococcus pentosaceus]|uniref:AbiH family protein n=1 Tax=Pediococcus pentosaceus TaxID=1255 RepID=UPI002AB53C00|nr:AbiH family protein [Pediococcus pentosaceus]MDY8105922.1 AbiH family protein [Pediococcus pentosaceus]
MEQLIVVGNGLDLAAGLHTKYDDFFRWLKNNMGEIDYSHSLGNMYFSSYIYGTIELNKNGNLTTKFAEMFDFWSGWFLTISNNKFMDDPVEWNDVENQIDKVLRHLIEYGEDTDYRSLIESFKNNIGEDDRGWRKSFSKSVDYYFRDWLFYLYIESGEQGTNKDIDFYKILLDELNKFEAKFAQYLCDEVISEQKVSQLIREIPNELYDRRKLLENIIEDESFSLDDTQVLNFNYTPIFKVFGVEQGFEKLEENIRYIHGSLKEDVENKKYIPNQVIFGIDDTALIDDDESDLLRENLYRFGKTYRIMNSKDESSLDLNRKIEMIKFYGHSLNSADYAYFQSIFDKVDLYGSNVELYFYYGDFEKDDSENQSKFMDRIYKLIGTYGQNTFKNTSEVKGKNLLHKLLLEGRIKTRYVSAKGVVSDSRELKI